MSVGICSVCGCPDRPWLRVETVAAALGMSGRNLRRALEAGKIEAVKLGRHSWRIKHANLDEFVARANNRADEGIIPATTPQEHAA